MYWKSESGVSVGLGAGVLRGGSGDGVGILRGGSGVSVGTGVAVLGTDVGVGVGAGVGGIDQLRCSGW